MSDFKVGDVVVLKSGGPEMTIDYIDDSRSEAKCVWFDDRKKLEAYFNPDSLQEPENEDTIY